MLPIGGLQAEDAGCNSRAGIKTIVIPEENVKDLAEIGDEVKSHLQIVPASRNDAPKVALQRMRRPRGGCGGGCGYRRHRGVAHYAIDRGPSGRVELTAGRSLRAPGRCISKPRICPKSTAVKGKLRVISSLSGLFGASPDAIEQRSFQRALQLDLCRNGSALGRVGKKPGRRRSATRWGSAGSKRFLQANRGLEMQRAGRS